MRSKQLELYPFCLQLVDDTVKKLGRVLMNSSLSVFQEHVNEIDFDYMDYARQRFEQYWLRKPELLGSSGPSTDGSAVGYSTT